MPVSIPVNLFETSAPDILTVEFDNLGKKRVTRCAISIRVFPVTLAGGIALAFELLTTLKVSCAEQFVRQWVKTGEWDPVTNCLRIDIGWPKLAQR